MNITDATQEEIQQALLTTIVEKMKLVNLVKALRKTLIQRDAKILELEKQVSELKAESKTQVTYPPLRASLFSQSALNQNTGFGMANNPMLGKK